MALHFANLEEKKSSGKQCGHGVGNRHTYPYARQSVEVGQYRQQRHQKQQLTCHRQENGFLRFADVLEESRRYDLESGDWECEYDYFEAESSGVEQGRVFGEESGYQFGEEVPENKTGCGDADRTGDGKSEGFDDTVELPRTVVESDDWLHTLVESVYNHDEEHQHTVDDAVRTD